MADYDYGNEQKKGSKSRVALIVVGLLWLVFSGLTIYFYSETSKLEEKNAKVEAKKKELEHEIEQLDQQMTAKDNELLNKDAAIKDLTGRLDQAKARLAELEGMRAFERNKAAEIRTKLKEYEDRILSMTQEKEQMESRVQIVQVQSDSLVRRVNELQAEAQRKQAEIDKQRGEIDRLNTTLNNIYKAFDFKFTDSKNETDLVLKRGKVRKGLKVAFQLTDFDNRPVNKAPSDLELEIRGIDKKNGGYRKTFSVESVSGGRATVDFDNEEFASGVYHLQAKYQGRLIGDASFMVK